MNRKQALLVKILLFIFSFNTLYLCLYFSSQSKAFTSNTKPHRSLAGNRLPLTENRLQNHLYSKPWPILPSYLPWTHFVASVGSCEAYFGNGFTFRLDLLKPRIQVLRKIGGNVGGWFRCWYSETLRSSICEGGRLRMSPEKISVSEGGETLEEVIGRREDKELPEFENGSFAIDGGYGFKGERNLVDQEFLDRYLPQGNIQRHTMRGLIGTLRIVEEKTFQCEGV